MAKYIGNLKTPLTENQGCLSLNYKQYSDIGVKNWYIVPKKPSNKYEWNIENSNWYIPLDYKKEEMQKNIDEKFINSLEYIFQVKWNNYPFKSSWLGLYQDIKTGLELKAIKENIPIEEIKQGLRTAEKERITVSYNQLTEIILEIGYKVKLYQDKLYAIKHQLEAILEKAETIEEIENLKIDFCEVRNDF